MPGLSKDGEKRGTLVLYQGKTGSDPVMFSRNRLGVCVRKRARGAMNFCTWGSGYL